MAKLNMNFIATTKEKLYTIPKKAGQIIFVIDDRAIYLDISASERTTYQAIISVVNEDTRQAISTPIEGFYYVRQTNALWSYYDGVWQELIGGNSGVIFVSNLPVSGQAETLYILNNKIYAWNTTTNNYYEVAGGGSGSIDWEGI